MYAQAVTLLHPQVPLPEARLSELRAPDALHEAGEVGPCAAPAVCVLGKLLHIRARESAGRLLLPVQVRKRRLDQRAVPTLVMLFATGYREQIHHIEALFVHIDQRTGALVLVHTLWARLPARFVLRRVRQVAS